MTKDEEIKYLRDKLKEAYVKIGTAHGFLESMIGFKRISPLYERRAKEIIKELENEIKN